VSQKAPHLSEKKQPADSRPPAEPFEIAGHTIRPGERSQFDVPGAQLYTHTPLHTTLEVIHGKEPGPVMLVCAAVHGDELNGVEIIRRLHGLTELDELSGTLLLVPVVNLHGFINQSRYLPDRRDLNRCFPGNKKGSLGSRIARGFFDTVVRRATHIIDLHTAAANRENLPQIRADLSAPGVEEIALGFSIPVIVNSGLVKKSLRAEAGKLGIPTVTYEAGEAGRLSEDAIITGLRGITNALQSLGMLANKTGAAKQTKPTIAQSSSWMRASIDGVFRPRVELGAQIEKGDAIGVVSSPFATREQKILARVSGIVIGITRQPLVNEGEALCHIATFDKPQDVAARIERQRLLISTDPLFESAVG